MLRRSSTSGSDRARAPWALVVTVLLVLAVEVVLRQVDFDRVTPYAWGLGEYDASALRLRTQGCPDVLVLGTSRTREALDLPHLKAALALRGARDLSIGNHALSGARAGEAAAVLDLALRRGRPRLVLIGLDPRLFQGTRDHADRQARFAPLSDVLTGSDPRTTAHAHLGSWLRTYGGRRRLRDALLGRHGFEPVPSPLSGDATDFQRTTPDTSLVTRPVAEAWIEAHLARIEENGEYALSTKRVAAVRRMIDACRRARVPVALFEVPVSRVWQRYLPIATMEILQEGVAALAKEEAVLFFSLEDLGVDVGPEDFLEPSHLNRRGARQLTAALAARLPLPE